MDTVDMNTFQESVKRIATFYGEAMREAGLHNEDVYSIHINVVRKELEHLIESR